MTKKVLLVLAVLSLCLVACDRTPKTYQDAEKQFISSLTQADTVAVLKLGSTVMRCLKQGQVDSAMLNLYVLKDDELRPMDEASKARFSERFTVRPVQSYMISGMSFSTPGVNDLSFRFSPNENVNNGALKLMFNPVKVDGQWYLAVKDAFMMSKDLASKPEPNAPVPAPVKLVLD